MRLILMGTAPAMASAEQDHIFLLLDGPAGFWLIDCGGSAAHQLLRRGYDPLQLRGIILTHGHADHIYGLPVFIQDLWLRGRRELLPMYANAPRAPLLVAELLEQRVINIPSSSSLGSVAP